MEDKTTQKNTNEYSSQEEYRKVCVPELEFNIYYAKSGADRFNRRTYSAILEDNNAQELIQDCLARELMHKLAFRFIDRGKSAVAAELFGEHCSNIMHNPIYRDALSAKDQYLATEIRFYCHKDTAEDCAYFSELFNKKFLPRLSEEYNKTYVIERSGTDFGLILRSGYNILHRPNIAMYKSTRKNVQLNPCTKIGVDAAGIDMEAIPFSEYLKLFETAKG